MPSLRSGVGAVIRLVSCLLFGVCLLVAAPHSHAEPVDVRMLLDGVRSLHVSAPRPVGGAIGVFGSGAFPVVIADSAGVRLSVVAGARWERGRAVAVGHPGLFTREALAQEENARFLTNAARWTSRGHVGAVFAVIDNPAAADILEQAGLAVVRWDVEQLRERMEAPDFEVAILDARTLAGKEGRRLAEFLSAFVKRGGGVVVSGRGADWRASPADRRTIREHGANRLMAPMGLGWIDADTPGSATDGWVADGRDLETADARLALQALWGHAAGSPLTEDVLRPMTALLVRTLCGLPADEFWFASRAEAFVERWATARVFPIALTQTAARVRAALEFRRARLRPADRQPAHPSAATFPGAPLASATAVPAQIHVAAGERGVRFTGVYAPPGAVVAVAATAADPGLAVRIGAHTARLWDRDTWDRYPEITVIEPVGRATKVASPFGGPVFIVLTRPAAVDIDLTVTGAIAMDRARVGSVRAAPPAFAPWTAWEGRRTTIFLPTRDARRTDAPERAIAQWDRLLDSLDAVLGTAPTPRRLLVDPSPAAEAGTTVVSEALAAALSTPEAPAAAEILAGVARTTLPDTLRAPGWDEAAAAVAGALAHGSGPLTAEERQEIRAAVQSGTDLPLGRTLTEMLLEVRDVFGAEPVGRALRDAAKATAGPTADRWLVALSRALGRDVAPHFDAFRVATSPDAKALASGLPPWNGLAAQTAPGPAQR